MPLKPSGVAHNLILLKPWQGTDGGAEVPVFLTVRRAMTGTGMAWREGMQRAVGASEPCSVR